MQGWGRLIVTAILTAAIAGCAPPYQSTRDLNVLFVGNSYTFGHDVPGLVEKLRPVHDGVRYRFSTAMLADGGQNLIEYVNDPRMLDLLGRAKWDVIVLQDRSVAIAYLDQQLSFQSASDWFAEAAAREGAALVFFQTWPRQAGHEIYDDKPVSGRYSPPRSPQDMYEQVARMYAQTARVHDATVAPVGQCWLRADDPARLYSNDGSHASLAGARLTARVIANTLSESDTPCDE